jgi:two-component system alkaline phosphatase synthesis response regulator PhoP
MPASILVVEDEEDIRELVRFNLGKEGFQVRAVGSGEEGLAAVEFRPPDLLLLDLMLPGVDGLSVCRKIKGSAKTRSVPIVILTAKGEEADVVTGLNLGADDYITKPFSPSVLVARIKAVLRRGEAEEAAGKGDEAGVIQIRNLKIHPGRHEVRVDDIPIELTSTEFRVLYFLARRPGWVFTRQQILDGVHGDNYAITERAVDVQIVGLRKKLTTAGESIETVRGVGYRFKE